MREMLEFSPLKTLRWKNAWQPSRENLLLLHIEQSQAGLQIWNHGIMAKWCLSFSAMFPLFSVSFSIFVLLSISFKPGDLFIMFNKKYQ
jgi:hypothetical protein